MANVHRFCLLLLGVWEQPVLGYMAPPAGVHCHGPDTQEIIF